MASERRIGGEDSKSRAVLLDAALSLMLDEGYASVTSRKVAARAGLKPQLVHYYFRTMDDLFLALLKRGGEQNLERQSRALESPRPLHELWKTVSDPHGTALVMELAALANHRPAIRAEITAAAERIRAQQVEVLTDVLDQHGITVDECPPVVAAILIAGISVLLALEQGSLGMSAGHAETITYVEEFLRRLEGERSNS